MKKVFMWVFMIVLCIAVLSILLFLFVPCDLKNNPTFCDVTWISLFTGIVAVPVTVILAPVYFYLIYKK